MSVPLWHSGRCVASVSQTLPPHNLEGILAVFRTVYKTLPLGGGTITPSYQSQPARREILRFIV